ncbi:hypothetical protein C8Q79DRAFT_974762 [Trametes meyenii]|nr:hypothetical protein C8Q79DRAFT_974762 [Trametes meyenii]
MSLRHDVNQTAAATTVLLSLPPLGKMSIVAIWIETLLYGISVVVFSGASYTLWNKRPRRSSVQWYLLLASTILFMISTVHVAVSLRQFLEAFTESTATAIPGYSSLYFLNQTNQLVFASQVLYIFNVLIQDLVLIWRLYAVMGSDWKAPMLPMTLEAVHTSSALYTVVRFFNGVPLEDPLVRKWGLLSWSLDLIINVGVTATIAGKIWWQGRQTACIHGHNAYIGIAYTMVESGALFSGATLVLFVLYINASTGLDAFVGVNPVVQLATLSPLLIVARVGFGLTHGTLADTAGPGQISTLRIDVNRSQVSEHPASSRDTYALQTFKSEDDV